MIYSSTGSDEIPIFGILFTYCKVVVVPYKGLSHFITWDVPTVVIDKQNLWHFGNKSVFLLEVVVNLG